MGAIAALVDLTTSENVVPQTIQMMEALRHRGQDCFGIATATHNMTSSSTDELKKTGFGSPVALGYNFERILDKDVPQPVSSEQTSFVFEGRIHPSHDDSDVCHALGKLMAAKIDPLRFLRSLNGSFIFAFVHGNTFAIARDPVGCRPLYEGKKDNFVGFASEGKALRAIGFESISSLDPGQCVTFNKCTLVRHRPLIRSRKVADISLNVATKELSRLLLRSLGDNIRDTSDIALAYSGGLDSGLLAASLKLMEKTPRLLHITAREGDGYDHARQSAKELGLELTTWHVTESEVVKAMPEVLFRTERPTPTQLAIALPAYFVSRLAERLGLPILLVGQGADELFGGYRRYLSILKETGKAAAANALRNDVLTCHGLNYERDEQATAGAHVEIRLPFADSHLVNFSLSLPLEYKISCKGGGERKIVLRKVAEMHGAPPSIYTSPKKAVQYSTGIDSLVRKLARRANISLHDYIKALEPDSGYGRNSTSR